MFGIRMFLGVTLASALLAQTPAPALQAGSQIDLQALSAATRALRRTSTASDESKSKADKLLSESQPLQASGQGGEARRRLANAYQLLKGEAWDAKQEFAWSLTLRPDNPVSDSSLHLIGHLAQTYSAPYRTANGLKMRATLCQDAKVIRHLSTSDVPSRDFIEHPFAFDGDLMGIADGAYTLRAEVLDGDAAFVTLEAPVQVVKGIATDWRSVEQRLARITGHDGAKATVGYPYFLAETVNTGRRQLNSADFGLPYQPQLPYDFAKGIRTSAEVLKSLEAGKDPVLRAKGDHERYYWFEEAGEMMAYHLYVPTKWDSKSKLPMVLVLHGNTRDQDYYFDRDDHTLAKMAEQHGYVVVCPMGFRPSAGWGSNSLNRRPPGAAAPGRGAPDPARAKQGELSEKDGLNVLEIGRAHV